MKKKELSEERTTLLLLGYLCIATEKDANLIRKVEILNRFGLSADELALICNCKTQSIRDVQQKLKRRKK